MMGVGGFRDRAWGLWGVGLVRWRRLERVVEWGMVTLVRSLFTVLAFATMLVVVGPVADVATVLGLAGSAAVGDGVAWWVLKARRTSDDAAPYRLRYVPARAGLRLIVMAGTLVAVMSLQWALRGLPSEVGAGLLLAWFAIGWGNAEVWVPSWWTEGSILVIEGPPG